MERKTGCDIVTSGVCINPLGKPEMLNNAGTDLTGSDDYRGIPCKVHYQLINPEVPASKIILINNNSVTVETGYSRWTGSIEQYSKIIKYNVSNTNSI